MLQMLRAYAVHPGCFLGLHTPQLNQHLLTGEGLTGVAPLTVARTGARSGSLQLRLHCPVALPVTGVAADAGVAPDERLGLGAVLRDHLAAVPAHCLAGAGVQHRTLHLPQHLGYTSERLRTVRLRGGEVMERALSCGHLF